MHGADADVVHAGGALGGRGELVGGGSAEAQHRLGADALPHRHGGLVGLADVHTVHLDALRAGRQVGVHVVVDQQRHPLRQHGGDLPDDGKYPGRVGVLLAHLHGGDAPGDGLPHGLGEAASAPGGLAAVGHQVHREVRQPLVLRRRAHAISSSRARSAGCTAASASSRPTAKLPGPAASAAARSAATP